MRRQEGALPVNGKQREAMRVVCELNGRDDRCGADVTTQAEVGPFLAREYGFWLDSSDETALPATLG